jgi:hypothetical protein
MCGCGIKTTFSKNPNNVNKSNLTSRSRVISTQGSLEKCDVDYKDLQTLNLNVLEMIRGGHSNTNNILSKMNNQIRSWVKNLKKECPPEEEFKVISKYIQDEYTEYKK